MRVKGEGKRAKFSLLEGEGERSLEGGPTIMTPFNKTEKMGSS